MLIKDTETTEALFQQIITRLWKEMLQGKYTDQELLDQLEVEGHHPDRLRHALTAAQALLTPRATRIRQRQLSKRNDEQLLSRMRYSNVR